MSVSRDDYYSVAADAQRLSTRLSEAEARIAELERERNEASARVVVKTRDYVRAKRERDEARTQAMTEHAENDRLRATIEPVRDWYDGDGERTDVVAMLHDAIEDLQRDRADALKLKKAEAKRDQALAACRAFVEAWDKSHQLEKTDVAYRLARAAIEECGQ
jgi:hypothetical protein